MDHRATQHAGRFTEIARQQRRRIENPKLLLLFARAAIARYLLSFLAQRLYDCLVVQVSELPFRRCYRS